MKLIGMLDSPYVRRVAVALQLMGVPFKHQSLSVFRGYAQFREINPVVKAPTLLFDDGEVLMDSMLILQYAEKLAARSLLPAEPAALRRDLRLTGLALAACEKAVQIVYEHNVRPPEKVHQPWMDRVHEQLRAACAALEKELAEAPLAVGADGGELTQAGVCTAVVWKFIQDLVPDSAPAADYPTIAAFSEVAEALPAFKAAPHGDGTYPVA
ncbi:glutathione S-transferase N-terminal domain-containing protein [Paucibacter sp. R3-3]|uniref:Glutathione S-transferase N-terminal domain-containing protein n=1 Tax=Roseateles agri TaxID=3098619 RepID=A0ABU5D9K4_9BURK|nr:glutathione S-transferase N-terminal domain-containing protein [Paucibacter sp. R3-3]MDY0742952.1 glutathione S-transferase N-terminal domain-containing protein [Paucibacter sp. R3-3]